VTEATAYRETRIKALSQRRKEGRNSDEKRETQNKQQFHVLGRKRGK